jgi:phosphate transport system substrate-binding protein
VLLWLGAIAGFAVGAEWIRSRPAPLPTPSGGVDLTGAGATFPYPLYRRWFEAYAAETGVRINYFAVGSTTGLALMLRDGADFGATDRPLTAEETARARCAPLVVPTAIGTVAVIAHLPGVAEGPRLDAATLAAIYAGAITRWDDDRLRALNPALALPALPIRPVHRGRGSGTAALLEAYLGSVASAAAPTPWIVGDSVEGNEGVAAQVQAVPGSLGFVEASYASHPRLLVAALRNRAGAFVTPDSLSLALAAEEGLAAVDVDTALALTTARAAGAYAIAGITRLVATGVLRDTTRARHFVAFARWALREGTPTLRALGFAPVPASVQAQVARRLAAVVPGACAEAS